MSQIQKFIVATAFTSSSLWAQLDVNSLSTRTVRAGQTWASINTSIDELILNIEVDRGVITTTAQVAYTPSLGLVYSNCLDAACTKSGNTLVSQDSLETTASFRLEDNSAITELYLWVGREKVRGLLQPRGLASAQYESIVRRRRDPALLETWGNGNYSLKIFPNASREQRRIEIVFVTGMEEEAGRFLANIPAIARRTLNTFGQEYPVNTYPTKHIPGVTLRASAVDGNSYALNLGSLGIQYLGAKPVQVVLQNVESLDSLSISGESERHHGFATPWISAREGTGYFGLKTLLTRGTAVFESEPTDRLVVLDVDNRSNPKNLDYARKLALLSLKTYGQSPFRANLGIRTSAGISFLFPSPLTMDAANLARAVEALRSAMPASQADFSAAFSSLRRVRTSGDARAVIIYLSDEYVDYNAVMGKSYDASKWTVFNAALTQRATDAVSDLRAANLVLFGYWNLSNLGEIARQTGGYSLGYIYPNYSPVVKRSDSSTFVFDMPVLFGPGRQNWNYYYYGWGVDIADLNVTSEHGNVHDLVVLQESPAYGYYYPMIMDRPMIVRTNDVVIMAGTLAKTSDAVDVSPTSRDSLKLRISGQYDRYQNAALRITGTWGGLRFEQSLQASLPNFSRAGSGGSSLWSYQQTEAWGRDADPDDVPAFQKLATDYHVMNRQMSLLALEPGMELWDSLPNGQNQTTTGGVRIMSTASNGVSADMMMISTGYPIVSVPGYLTLDSLSLEDILLGRAPLSIQQQRIANFDFSIRQQNGSICEFYATTGSTPPQFEIMDLSGRKVARLESNRNGDTWVATWNSSGRRGGFYAIARAGERTVSRKFAVVR